jgi:hypothetical protein
VNITISGRRWFSIGSLFSFLLRSCTRGNIIGKWDRDGIPDSLYSFSIYKDSTFFINVHEKPSKNHIPGWHVGNQRGTWKILNKDYLLLYEIPNQFKYPTSFKIITLTNNMLVLNSPMSNNFLMKFKRKNE